MRGFEQCSVTTFGQDIGTARRRHFKDADHGPEAGWIGKYDVMFFWLEPEECSADGDVHIFLVVIKIEGVQVDALLSERLSDAQDLPSIDWKRLGRNRLEGEVETGFSIFNHGATPNRQLLRRQPTFAFEPVGKTELDDFTVAVLCKGALRPQLLKELTLLLIEADRNQLSAFILLPCVHCSARATTESAISPRTA
jgi:hypothetical protein